MAKAEPNWWEFRRAQNLSASVYRCPFCDQPLPALTDHYLVTPEGDGARRRHAHTECVAAERRAGRLPSRGEWMATQPPRPGLWERVRGFFARS